MRAWLLTAQAWTELLYLEWVRLRGFRAIHKAVSGMASRNRAANAPTVASVVEAATTAYVWYPKETACLQRSAVVTRLLRKHGVDAQMLIGCHQLPMRSHAWVEVAGEVVSDTVDDLEHYQILDRW